MSLKNKQSIIAVIDWETLDTKPTAVVLSLAITYFTVNKNYSIDELVTQTKSWNLNSTAQMETGRTTSEDTMLWWTKQDKKAVVSYLTEPFYSLNTLIKELKEYIVSNNIEYLIGNGIGFDNAILKNICDQLNMPYPVAYWGDLDLRTLRWLADIERPEFPKELTQHIAANDTVAEALEFLTYYNSIKK